MAEQVRCLDCGVIADAAGSDAVARCSRCNSTNIIKLDAGVRVTQRRVAAGRK